MMLQCLVCLIDKDESNDWDTCGCSTTLVAVI